MNPYAIVLALLAIAAISMLFHRRRRERNEQRVRMERVMASLKSAVSHANSIEEMPAHSELQQAS